jgi:hypothetical protein
MTKEVGSRNKFNEVEPGEQQTGPAECSYKVGSPVGRPGC